jgi:mercuric reductase
MKHFDALVLGSGESAVRMADALSQEHHSIAVAVPTGMDEAPLEHILQTLSHQPPTAPQFPSTVELLNGGIRFQSPSILTIDGNTVSAKKIVIATGARFHSPVYQGLSLSALLTPAQLLASKLTSSYILLGHGPLAVAIGYWLRSMEAEVTLISESSRLLPCEEPEISAAAAETFLNLGGRLALNISTLQFRREDNRLKVAFDQDGQRREIQSEEGVIAQGLRANTENLGLEQAGVYITDKGFVAVDEEMKTSSRKIYAVGPVTEAGRTLNSARHQIQIAAHNMFAPPFSKQRLAPGSAPFQIPMNPSFARVGMGESEAKRRWRDAKSAVMPVPNGILKLVGLKKSGRILGAHLFCPGAAELSLFFNLAIQMELSVSDLDDPISYFPLTASSYAENLIRTWTGA